MISPNPQLNTTLFLRRFGILIIILLVSIGAFAQKKGAATAAAAVGSGAKPTASTAGGGSFVTGYNYFLPRNYHVQYKTVNDTILSVVKIPDPKIAYSSATITQQFISTWKFHPSKKPPYFLNEIMLSTPVKFNGWTYNYKCYYLGDYVKTDTTYCMIQPQPCCSVNHDSVVIVTNRCIKIDTIDRYYKANGFWSDLNPFKMRRLKVAVTQGDSGKLAVLIKKKDFPHKTDPRSSNFVIYSPTGEISPALPFAGVDSANNFFLLVTRKNLLNDEPNFLPLDYTMIQYGAVTIPFKYRFNTHRLIGGTSSPTDPTKGYEKNIYAPSESTASINVAAYICKKWGATQFNYDATNTHNTVSFMLAWFAGPSLITQSANNVNYNTDLNRISSQQLAFSTGVAMTLEVRSFNFGLFYGYDIPVESSPRVYRYRPWIGVGIGFSLGMFSNSNAQSQISGTP